MPPTYQFDGDEIDWIELADPSQEYPCKYQMAILGADPATVFFALHSIDGTVFETLDEDMNELDASTVAETASNLGFANPGTAA